MFMAIGQRGSVLGANVYTPAVTTFDTRESTRVLIHRHTRIYHQVYPGRRYVSSSFTSDTSRTTVEGMSSMENPL